MLLKKTLGEIAEFIGGELEGNGDLIITSVAGIQDAGPGQLSFIIDEKYISHVSASKASALIVARGIEVEGFDLIRVDDPASAWKRILDLIRPPSVEFDKGIHNSAVISKDARVSDDSTIMANVVIEAGAVVESGSVIYPGVYIGLDSKVGNNCLIYPNVTIRERITIGNSVIIHSGSVIGSDGFGYEPDETGRLKKQEQFGAVVLEDDVEIGANVTIDRARFDVTRIGRGTKVDNLVQIAHNVIIGENCIIISQTGIAGSARLGKNVILAGQVGVVGHLTIGDNVKVAAKSGISKDVPDNAILFGQPAINHTEKKREIISIRKLPGLLKTVKALAERVERLESQSENN